ncbi:MAG: VanW family protein [Candidatus Uhrbacteria bacterium]|nr:VanW family protein [Candidatus Uhrbacteria bacterium]
MKIVFHHNAFDHISEGFKRNKKIILIATSASTLTFLIVAGGIFAYEKAYTHRIYPNVYIDGTSVSGLTQTEVNQVLQNRYQEMLDNGLVLKLQGEEKKIDLYASGSTDLVYDLIDLDTDKLADEIFKLGRSGSSAGNLLSSLSMLVIPTKVEPKFTILTSQLENTIRETFADFEEPGEITDFEITLSDSPVVVVKAGKEGTTINTEEAIQILSEDLLDFELSTLSLSMIDTDELITTAEAEGLIAEIEAVLAAAPYTLIHTSESQRDYSWYVTDDDLADWLTPIRNEEGDIILDLQGEAFDTWIEVLTDDVNIAPQDARFAIEGNKVVEFNPSRSGVTFDSETTIAELIELLGTEDVEITITIETVEPAVSTESVNDLGITEILGVGTSDFAGSPYNRIENIKNGASKLDGLLIAPGETKSLIDELKPFTYDNGYLSELVIKGDEIKPEMGGGLCQIGTTTFRAVMNAGLEIVERRNHSLVVSYYNDPSNGNPGTDATIYEPAPDFKFKNDTENYVLLNTWVDTSSMTLYFTFWGTSDGRNAYYTPPQILSWSGYGTTQEVETLDLEPGERRCQSGHPGASTSFNYIVEYADGTEFNKTFTSVYRTLPQICLVGVAELSAETEDAEELTDTKVLEEPVADAEELDVSDVIVE